MKEDAERRLGILLSAHARASCMATAWLSGRRKALTRDVQARRRGREYGQKKCFINKKAMTDGVVKQSCAYREWSCNRTSTPASSARRVLALLEGIAIDWLAIEAIPCSSCVLRTKKQTRAANRETPSTLPRRTLECACCLLLYAFDQGALLVAAATPTHCAASHHASLASAPKPNFRAHIQYYVPTTSPTALTTSRLHTQLPLAVAVAVAASLCVALLAVAPARS